MTKSQPSTGSLNKDGDQVDDKSPVETVAPVASTLHAEPSTVSKNQTNAPVSVATDVPPCTIDSSIIEPMLDNPDDDLLLSQYPWMKTAKLCLDKVSPITIDIWINEVKTYWHPRKSVGTKVVQQPPMPTHDRRYSSHNVKLEPSEDLADTNIKQENADQDTGTSPEDLIKHAETILERAKRINNRTSTPRKRKSRDKLDVGTEVPKIRSCSLFAWY